MSLVVQSGSKQYVLELGQKFLVDRLDAEINSTIDLHLIHAYGTNDGLKAVKATVLNHLKGEKIRVVKFKSKSNYHRQYGHRTFLTELLVEGGLPKPIKVDEKVTEENVSEVKKVSKKVTKEVAMEKTETVTKPAKKTASKTAKTTTK